MTESIDVVLGELPTISPMTPGLWVHNPAEDIRAVGKYRQGGLNPLVAGQETFRFGRDGSVVLRTNDGERAAEVHGRWHEPAPDRLLLRFDGDSPPSFILQVIEWTDALGALRARRLSADLPTISPALPGRWTHSWAETDAHGVETYRRSDSDVPKESQTIFDFGRDGSVTRISSGIGGEEIPTANGRWVQPSDDRIAISLADFRRSFVLELVEEFDVVESVFRARRLPQGPLAD